MSPNQQRLCFCQNKPKTGKALLTYSLPLTLTLQGLAEFTGWYRHEGELETVSLIQHTSGIRVILKKMCGLWTGPCLTHGDPGTPTGLYKEIRGQYDTQGELRIGKHFLPTSNKLSICHERTAELHTHTHTKKPKKAVIYHERKKQ